MGRRDVSTTPKFVLGGGAGGGGRSGGTPAVPTPLPRATGSARKKLEHDDGSRKRKRKRTVTAAVDNDDDSDEHNEHDDDDDERARDDNDSGSGSGSGSGSDSDASDGAAASVAPSEKFSSAVSAILAQRTKRDNPVLEKRRRGEREVASTRAAEQEARRETLLRKRLRTQQHVVPELARSSYERTLHNVARKGVVKLFNAVLSAQRATADAAADADAPSSASSSSGASSSSSSSSSSRSSSLKDERRRVENVRDMTKSSFLSMLKASGGGANASAPELAPPPTVTSVHKKRK